MPVHVALIKTANIQTEGNWNFLRINLAVPGTQNINMNSMVFPPINGQNSVFIRDFTFKSTDNKSLPKACKDIKELIKRFKQKDKERQEDNQIAKPE